MTSALLDRRGVRHALLPLVIIGLLISGCEDEPEDLEVGVTGPSAGEDVADIFESDDPLVSEDDAEIDLDQLPLGTLVTVPIRFVRMIGPHLILGARGHVEEAALILVPVELELPEGLGPDGEGTLEVTGELVELGGGDLESEIGEPLEEGEVSALGESRGERAIIASALQFASTKPGAEVDAAEVGEEVTVSGEIAEVISFRLLVVSEDDPLDQAIGGTPILIPSSIGIPDDIIEGAIVEVSGSAVEIEVAAIESDFRRR